MTFLVKLHMILEAHGCKPWVTNLSIVPHTLHVGILTTNITSELEGWNTLMSTKWTCAYQHIKTRFPMFQLHMYIPLTIRFCIQWRFCEKEIGVSYSILRKGKTHVGISSFVLWNAIQTKVECEQFKPLHNHPKTILPSSKHKLWNAFEAVWAKRLCNVHLDRFLN